MSRIAGHAAAAWRADYRAEHIPAWDRGRAHLAFTSISCLGGIALCDARLRPLRTHHRNPALMQRNHFNITYPSGDRLFGTYFRFSGPCMSGRAIRGDLRSEEDPV